MNIFESLREAIEDTIPKYSWDLALPARLYFVSSLARQNLVYAGMRNDLVGCVKMALCSLS